MCLESPEAHKIAERLLFGIVPTPPGTARAVAAPPKWKRYEACMNCHAEFNVETTMHGDCQYHSGTLCRSVVNELLLTSGFQAESSLSKVTTIGRTTTTIVMGIRTASSTIHSTAEASPGAAVRQKESRLDAL